MDLAKDPLHFLNCIALKRTSGLTGHDTINKIILESCRNLYQRCVWQPLHLAGSKAEEQPDFYIEFNQNSIRKIIADVVVTNCQAASYRDRAVWNCKAVLADRERLKESKYAHLAFHSFRSGRVAGTLIVFPSEREINSETYL